MLVSDAMLRVSAVLAQMKNSFKRYQTLPLVLGAQIEGFGGAGIDVEDEGADEEQHDGPAEGVGARLALEWALKHQPLLLRLGNGRRLRLHIVCLQMQGLRIAACFVTRNLHEMFAGGAR